MKTIKSLIIFIIFCIAIIGCRTVSRLTDIDTISSSPYRFHNTCGKKFKSLSTWDCSLKIATTKPPKSMYLEIGVIEYEFTDKKPPMTNISNLKKEIEPIVCCKGGNLAVANPNNEGQYLRAIIYRKN